MSSTVPVWRHAVFQCKESAPISSISTTRLSQFPGEFHAWGSPWALQHSSVNLPFHMVSQCFTSFTRQPFCLLCIWHWPPKNSGDYGVLCFFFELTSGFSTQLTKHLTPALLTEEWQIGLKRNFDAAQERLKNRNFEADQARLNKHTVDPDSWIGYWNSLFSHKKRCEMCSNTFQKNDKLWVCVWTLKRLKQSCTLPLGRSFATNLVGSKVAATLSPSAWRKSRTFPAKRYCGVWRDHSGGTLHRFFSRETNCGHVRDMRWYDCINWHKHCFRQLEFRNAVGLAGSSLRTVGLVRGWNQSFGG